MRFCNNHRNPIIDYAVLRQPPAMRRFAVACVYLLFSESKVCNYAGEEDYAGRLFSSLANLYDNYENSKYFLRWMKSSQCRDAHLSVCAVGTFLYPLKCRLRQRGRSNERFYMFLRINNIRIQNRYVTPTLQRLRSMSASGTFMC